MRVSKSSTSESPKEMQREKVDKERSKVGIVVVEERRRKQNGMGIEAVGM